MTQGKRSELARRRRAEGYSQEALADKLGIDRSTVIRWERGETAPQPWHRRKLAKCLRVSTDDLDRILQNESPPPSTPSSGIQSPQPADRTLTPLAIAAGRADVDRRGFLKVGVGGAFAGTALGIVSRTVGAGDLAAVRDTITVFSAMDQRHGGGHARTAVREYLASDVARHLNGHFTSDEVRRGMFSAAAELSYLVGWMAFDAHEHETADLHFRQAAELAIEAEDPPLTGHILRAMAHQAIDLGNPMRAAQLADASVDGDRYTHACHRERALLGVIHARSLVATGQSAAAAKALVRAENDLASSSSDEGPQRVFFFGEAALAHETGCALRDMGDLPAAEKQLAHSVETRKAAFARTHSVTLGYLADVQARRGDIDTACSTWSDALNVMDSVRSGRAVRNAITMRENLRPYVHDGLAVATEVDDRTTHYLARAQ